MAEDRTPHRTHGPKIELGQPRGERGAKVRRDENESVLEKLFAKNLIGQPEYDAGLEYHKHLKKAAAGYGVPDLGRIPGQGDHDADTMQCEAVLWLEKINKRMPRSFATVLSLALHPWSHASLSEIDRQMGYPENKMHGRLMLIEALGQLSELLGFATRDRRDTKYG